MSFLTSEEAGLGQHWYDESNVVAGVGGLLSMSELTSLQNYYKEPPMFPASVGLNGLGLPVSDLIPGELESARTLVDTTSVGNVRHKRNQGWRGRRRRKRGHIKQIKAQGLCREEIAARQAANKAFRSCARKHIAHTRTQVQGGVAEAGTPATTVASEGHVLNGLGGMGAGSPIPIRDLSHGEYETAGRMISHDQAFGSRAVPISDLVPGEYMTGSTLVDHAQGFGSYVGQYGGPVSERAAPIPYLPGEPTHAAQMLSLPQAGGGVPRAAAARSHAAKMLSLPQSGGGVAAAPASMSHSAKMLALPQAGSRAVPEADLVPGELTHAAKMIALPQAFGGMGAGSPVPVSDFVRGEITPGSRLAAQRQGFGGMGAGWPVPRSDFVPGEIVSGSTLVDHAQGFGGLGAGYAVPRRDFTRGEIESAARMLSRPQAFGGMGDWIPYTPGEVEPAGGAQGSFLSPDQVPAWDRESAASIVAQPQNFGGLGAGSPVPRGDFVEGEIESAARLARHPQAFGGMGRHPDDGSFLPYTPGEPEPADGGQGTWLSPDQVPAWDRESARKLISQHQAFGGLGAGSPVPIRDLVPGEYTHAAQMISLPQAFGGMGASGDNVRLPSNLNLSPICDPQTGACISYATPQEVRSAIGRKIGGQSALIQSKAKLPAFYEHPNLGPWGVDPAQAYQYWWAQQAAMQRQGAEAPIPIWGSPGFVPTTQPLPPSPIAQEAAFNPYTNAYPVAGTSVERF
jgi:hypothetical protein